MAELCTDIVRYKIKNWNELLKNRADWKKSIKEAMEEEEEEKEKEKEKEKEEELLLLLLLLLLMTTTTSISDTLKKVCIR